MFAVSPLVLWCTIYVGSIFVVGEIGTANKHQRNIEQAQIYYPGSITVRPEAHNLFGLRITHGKMTKKMPADKINIKITETQNGKFDGITDVLDDVAEVISKPVAIINIIRVVALSISSLLMSASEITTRILPVRRERIKKERETKYGLIAQTSNVDLNILVNIVTRKLDEFLDTAELKDRSACRERYACILGDMVAYDFPIVVFKTNEFAQHYLQGLDIGRNKYTSAFAYGLNHTNCDKIYKTKFYECPTVLDFARSFLAKSIRKRRSSVKITKKRHSTRRSH